MAGYTINGRKGTIGIEDFALVRYNLNGTLDTSFGGTGEVTTDLGTAFDVAKDVAIQPDGKIVAAGYADGNFALVRCNADGSLDTSFGGSSAEGEIITQVGGKGSFNQGYSLALQPDGKIVVSRRWPATMSRTPRALPPARSDSRPTAATATMR